MLGFGDTKDHGCSSSKVCMWEISFRKGVGCSGCKASNLSLLTFVNRKDLVVEVAKYVCGKLVVQRVLFALFAKVANLVCDYLGIKICSLRWLQGFLHNYIQTVLVAVVAKYV